MPFKVTTAAVGLVPEETRKLMDCAPSGTRPVWLSVGDGPAEPKY